MSLQVQPRTSGIQVISRAAHILRTLGNASEGLSLGQIAHKVNLPRSTVQRIVGALADEGLISTEQGSGGIRLGPEIQTLARASARKTKDLLHPMMRGIADQTGETVDLAVLDAGKMLFIDQIVGSHRLRTVSSIGERFPLATTANGKAALACLDEADAAHLVLAEFEASNTHHPVVARIMSEIERIRQGALAADVDEHTDGVSALGFAVRDTEGDIYAISVPVPSSRFVRQKDALSATLLTFRDQIKAQT